MIEPTVADLAEQMRKHLTLSRANMNMARRDVVAADGMHETAACLDRALEHLNQLGERVKQLEASQLS